MQENSDDEDDDLTILPSDRLVLSVKTEDDISNLEVNIYEEADDNLYTHHDVMLPSFPLCLEWINYEPSTDGTALGTFLASVSNARYSYVRRIARVNRQLCCDRNVRARDRDLGS